MKRVLNEKIEKIITTQLNNLKLVVNNNIVRYKTVKKNEKIEKIMTMQLNNMKLLINIEGEDITLIIWFLKECFPYGLHCQLILLVIKVCLNAVLFLLFITIIRILFHKKISQ